MIRDEAQKARDPFFDDLRSVDDEPAIQRMKEREQMAKEGNEAETTSIEETEEIPSPARRIRKPRFVKPAQLETEKAQTDTVEEPTDKETNDDEVVETEEIMENDAVAEPEIDD